MTRARFLCAFFTLAFLAGAAHAQLYRWTDEKGGVHVTDTPPPASARALNRQKPRANAAETAQPSTGQQPTGQLPYELAVAMKDFPVALYTSPNCKQGCELARSALNKRGVPFREVQVWDQPSTDELKKLTGADQVPTLVVGRSVHQGFRQDAYDQLLDSARYPKVGAVAARNQAAPPAPEGYADPQAAKAEPRLQEEESRPVGPYAPGAPRQGSRASQK
jgi:glutaredoxin